MKIFLFDKHLTVSLMYQELSGAKLCFNKTEKVFMLLLRKFVAL